MMIKQDGPWYYRGEEILNVVAILNVIYLKKNSFCLNSRFENKISRTGVAIFET